jgi:hypothetical protein
MKRRSGFLFFLPFCAALAMASPITYDVTVNTSSLSGTTGSLDLNFNPGPLVTQAADLQILDFTGGSFESCASNVQGFCNTGNVTGTLPGTLTFNNGTGYNDYFDGFTYGSTISFEVSLYGPALSAPDGTATSGSTFAFSMYSDSGGMDPVLTSNAGGFAFTVGVNLNGTTTVTNYSAETTVVPETGTIGAVPEPGNVALIALGLVGIGLVRRKMQQRNQPVACFGESSMPGHSNLRREHRTC